MSAVKDALRLRKVMRQICRTDLLKLCEVIGYPDVSRKVHGPILDVLQKFPGGTDVYKNNGTIEYTPHKKLWDLEGCRKTLVLYPRGHLKTTLVTQAHMIQWIVNYPNIRILLSCFTGDQVENVVRKVKGVFQHNEFFRALFPEFCPPREKANDFGTKDQFITPARNIVLGEPTVFSVTVGKTIAGYHPDVIFHSDIVDKENIKTPGGIKDVTEHFKYMNPLLERYNATSGRAASRGWVYVEGTPYDFGDLHNDILDDRDGSYTDWVKVARPAQENFPTGPILWPERFPAKELANIRKEMGEWMFCTPQETPILMADWTFSQIKNVKVGDSVVGWNDSDLKPKLRPAKVIATGSLLGKVIEFQMESGRIVRCTPDHKWFSGRREIYSDHHKRYQIAGLHYHALKSLCFVADPAAPLGYHSAEQAQDAAWLGGMFDGEGSIGNANHISFCQTTGKNRVVCDKLRRSLASLGFRWAEYTDKPKPEKWTERTQFLLKGGFATSLRFLRMCQPARREEISAKLYARSSSFVKAKDRIVSVKECGLQEVYWLETETGNYVAWGYASKNSAQYLMKCIPEGDGLCDTKDVVFIPQEVVSSILPTLRLRCTIDTSNMDPSKRGDYTVLTVGGFDRDGRLYIIDCRCGRYSPEEVVDLIFYFHKQYPNIIDYKMEADVHACMIMPTLQRETSKRAVYPIITPIKRDTQVSKQTRIKGLRPWFKKGIIRFNQNLSLQVRQELLNEIAKFPSQSSGVHDDILDTLADLMQDGEGGVTMDVIADPEDMRFTQFGRPRPQNKFLGFTEEGVSRWLYGNDEQNSTERSQMTGVM